MNFKDKHIVILGSSESGLGALQLAIANNIKVSVSDNSKINGLAYKIIKENNIPFEENLHSFDFISKADIIIKSPGISPNLDILKKINKNKIIDEVEFAYSFNKATNIAVTGTNGKTTTTSLIYHILKPHYTAPYMAGNIGTSVSKTLVHYIPDLLVTELSSFQIDGLKNYKPNVAIYTNITTDHLDRYNGSFDQYAKAKWQLTKNLMQENILVLNDEDKIINALQEKYPTKATVIPFSLNKKTKDKYDNYAYYDKEKINIKVLNRKEQLRINELPFNGKHQIMNVMASLIATLALKPYISFDEIIERLKCFTSIPHRMEPCGKVNGRLFINDSKATNVEASRYALDAYRWPITWIAGGYDKGNDYKEILDLAKSKVKQMVFLGTDNTKLKNAFKEIPFTEANNMKNAVEKAYIVSGDNATILLSPMCASFDLFTDYIDRGNQFKNYVQLLKSS